MDAAAPVAAWDSPWVLAWMVFGGTLFVELGDNIARLSGNVTPVYRGTYFGGELLRDENDPEKHSDNNLRKDSEKDSKENL